jgi:hypothetical protein
MDGPYEVKNNADSEDHDLVMLATQEREMGIKESIEYWSCSLKNGMFCLTSCPCRWPTSSN